MKPSAKVLVSLLVLAGAIVLSAGPASAEGTIAINPVTGTVPTGSIIEITGTTTFPAGTNLQYEFSRETAGTGGARYGEYSGATGIVSAEGDGGSRTWTVPVSTTGYSPGNYTFRIGKEGEKATVSLIIPLVQGAASPTPSATQADTDALFKAPVYVSPQGTFTVRTVPDLNARRSILAKGAPLELTVTTSSGNRIGIWTTSASPRTAYTRFQPVSADGSGNAEYSLINTTGMNSGQYFLYVVDGGTGLAYLPDTNDPSAYLSPDTLEAGLNAHEQQNPYQKFMILLEEPTITITDLPEAATGTSVELEGTTNLNSETFLDLAVFPPEIDRMKQPVSSVSRGVIVADESGGYRGTWHATIDTSGLAPGEYIVKVRNGTVEAAGLLVLYDKLYDANGSPGASLAVATYDVDPATREVVTGTPARAAGSRVHPAIPFLFCLAVLAGAGAAGSRRKR